MKAWSRQTTGGGCIQAFPLQAEKWAACTGQGRDPPRCSHPERGSRSTRFGALRARRLRRGADWKQCRNTCMGRAKLRGFSAGAALEEGAPARSSGKRRAESRRYVQRNSGSCSSVEQPAGAARPGGLRYLCRR